TIPDAITAPERFAKLPPTKTATAIIPERTSPAVRGRRSSAMSDARPAGRGAGEGRRLLFRARTEAVMLELARALTRQLAAVRTGLRRTALSTSSFGPKAVSCPLLIRAT